MPKRKDYEETLSKLEAALRRRAMTAREIAEKFHCCKPVVYARLAALEARGLVLEVAPSPTNRPGPCPISYSISG